MKILLNNKIELHPIMVTGESRYIQNANRDVLTFVFDENVSLDDLDSIFIEQNCENITIFEEIDGEEMVYIHNGYTIRTELRKAFEVAQPATSSNEEIKVKRVFVSMAQRTYAESKLALLSEENTNTQLAIAELAEIVVGGE